MTSNNPERSNCCQAPIKATHGCDDDFLHGGKKCTCEIVTSWYVCEKCKRPCDPMGHEMGEQSKIDVCLSCKRPIAEGEECLEYAGAFECKECAEANNPLAVQAKKWVGREQKWEDRLNELLENNAGFYSLRDLVREIEKEAYERGRANIK